MDFIKSIIAEYEQETGKQLNDRVKKAITQILLNSTIKIGG